MNAYSLLLALNLLFGQPETTLVTQGNKDKIPLLSYCDLIANPELHDNKIVRVKVSYYTGFEGGFFYDLACDEVDKRAYSAFYCDDEKACKKLRETLNKSLTGNVLEGRVELVIVGRFRGPGAYGKTHPLQEGFRFQLDVNRIEKTITIPSNTPWPSDD